MAASAGVEAAGRPALARPSWEARTGGRESLALDGSWQFQSDPESIGLRDRWYHPAKRLDAQLEVPGCWRAQGVGPAYKWLRHDYLGKAWYKREVSVPEPWRGRLVWLNVGGVTRSARAFCNRVEVGYHNGFCSPCPREEGASEKEGGRGKQGTPGNRKVAS